MQFFVNQLVWIGIPISLVAIIGTFLLLNIYIRRIMARMGSLNSNIMEFMFNTLSSDRGLLKYCLMSSPTSHKQIAYHRCTLHVGFAERNIRRWANVKVIQRAMLYNKYKDLILLNKNIIVAGICPSFQLHLLLSTIIHNTTIAISQTQ